MGEVEIIKVIVQGGAIGLSAGLIVLLGIVILRFFRQDEQDSRERQIMLSLFENILNRQFGKFEELTGTIQAGMADVVQQLQDNFTTSLERLVERVDGRVSAVTTARDAKLELMHADLKTVPAEVRRVLAEDLVAQTTAIQAAIGATSESHQETIREAVTQALQPYLDQLEEKLDQMPGTEATRRMMRDEVEKLHRRLIEQVSEQTTPVLDKLNEIAAALDRLQPPGTPSLAEGGETPSDETLKDKENVVGTAS